MQTYLASYTVKTLREIAARMEIRGRTQLNKDDLINTIGDMITIAHGTAVEINDDMDSSTTFTRIEITDPALLALAAADIIDADADNDFQNYVSATDNAKISRVRYVDMGYNMRDYTIREAYDAQNGVRDRLTPAQRRRLAKRENKQYGYLMDLAAKISN